MQHFTRHLDPVVDEHRLHLGHHRAAHLKVAVTPMSRVLGVAGPLRRNADTAREADVPVDDQELAVRAVVDPAHGVGLRRAEERDLDARGKITSALTYPAVIMAMSVVVVVILVGFVLPRFETFFEGLNAELPLPTRILLGGANVLTAYWYVIAALVAEYFGGPADGIGTAIATYAKSGRASLAFAYVAGGIAIGLVFFLVTSLLEWLVSRRKPA